MNRSIDLGMMTTIAFWSPSDTALNCQNPPNAVPNSSPQIIFSILIGSNNNNTDRVTQV
jgi:hypothetical protein